MLFRKDNNTKLDVKAFIVKDSNRELSNDIATSQTCQTCTLVNVLSNTFFAVSEENLNLVV